MIKITENDKMKKEEERNVENKTGREIIKKIGLNTTRGKKEDKTHTQLLSVLRPVLSSIFCD